MTTTLRSARSAVGPSCVRLFLSLCVIVLGGCTSYRTVPPKAMGSLHRGDSVLLLTSDSTNYVLRVEHSTDDSMTGYGKFHDLSSGRWEPFRGTLASESILVLCLEEFDVPLTVRTAACWGVYAAIGFWIIRRSRSLNGFNVQRR